MPQDRRLKYGDLLKPDAVDRLLELYPSKADVDDAEGVELRNAALEFNDSVGQRILLPNGPISKRREALVELLEDQSILRARPGPVATNSDEEAPRAHLIARNEVGSPAARLMGGAEVPIADGLSRTQAEERMLAAGIAASLASNQSAFLPRGHPIPASSPLPFVQPAVVPHSFAAPSRFQWDSPVDPHSASSNPFVRAFLELLNKWQADPTGNGNRLALSPKPVVLPDRIWKLIASGAYVDLAKCLPLNIALNNLDDTRTIKLGGDLEIRAESKPVATLEDFVTWAMAFRAYQTGVEYLFPCFSEYGVLNRYFARIQGLAYRRPKSWPAISAYDVARRQHVASNPTATLLDSDEEFYEQFLGPEALDLQLHLAQLKADDRVEPARKRARGNPGSNSRRDPCRNWNRGACVPGSNCPFGRSHTCETCGGRHRSSEEHANKPQAAPAGPARAGGNAGQRVGPANAAPGRPAAP